MRFVNKKLQVLVQALLLGLFLLVPMFSTKGAISTSKQREVVRQINKSLLISNRFLKSKQYAKASLRFTKAQQGLLAAAEGGFEKKNRRSLERALEKLTILHQALTKSGAKPPKLNAAEIQAAFAAKKTNPENKDPESGETESREAGQVSFSKKIAPLLVAKCGECHIEKTKGDFSLASYEALMQGADGNPVLTRGGAKGSLLIDLIESGDMPRGGGAKVSEAELKTLMRWIDQGANLDGPLPGTPLRTILRNIGAKISEPEVKPRKKKIAPLKISRATGQEKVSFALDIAPVLEERCIRCHGERNPRAGLRMTSFSPLLKGGDSGPVFSPGKPDQSLLYKMMLPSSDPRMPLKQTPLSAQTLEKFKTWIAEGAKFDGDQPTDSLTRTNAFVKAVRATSEELSQMRVASANQIWHLAIPEEKPEHRTTKNFHLVGNLLASRLKKLGELAETEQEQVARFLKAEKNKSFTKGRITIFLFTKRFDYSEFGTMVEKKNYPRSQKGHWAYTFVDSYAAIYPGSSDSDELKTGVGRLLAQQIAALYLTEHASGKVPRWFITGSARAVAAKIHPKDPEVIRWRETVATLKDGQQIPSDFMNERIAPEKTELLAFGFIETMLRKPNKYFQVLDQVTRGVDFEKALLAVYKKDSKQLIARWSKKKVENSRNRRSR